jgi:hypothetical protein
VLPKNSEWIVSQFEYFNGDLCSAEWMFVVDVADTVDEVINDRSLVSRVCLGFIMAYIRRQSHCSLALRSSC